ncbi:MAG: ClbS/DfsB family four-helix bundle protein [Wolinella succinogenes]|uniref:ClbS/DfsB family four-helix bundle protein n=1 Tax=Wolinella succinogenes TaxID=844 RepID=UPI0016994F7F|nr:ClbS/DfsB family four-helix bundle protein [Wolinella succinogenes]NLU34429.1 ClbS/DfsB family four-helix bundle protein [Wolinella succinogenes]
MPRAMTKLDLLKDAISRFEKLWELIDSMSEKEQVSAFNFGDNFRQKEAHWERDKNLRDVLVHLYEWHQLLLHWVESNQRGEAKSFLPEPYNWKTYGKMNMEFWYKHQATPYEEAKKMLYSSHKHVITMIEQLTNEALFTKQHFNWTGTSTLGAYCVSATSSHYDWAMKKIKTHIKTYRQVLS